MSLLSVQLCGKFYATYDGESIKGLELRKVQELFSYLLLFRSRPHSREMLAGILWGDTSANQARANLRKVLWHLQAALAQPPDGVHDEILVLDADWVQINPQARLSLDVAVIDAAFTAAQGQPGEELSAHAAGELRAAVDLYQGDLLEGWYADWCLFERERLQNMYLALVNKLMAYCEANHEYDQGIRYGMEVLRYDRAREETHRRLMQIYALAGDRTAALRQYERCAAALREELGVQPTPYTSNLHERIKDATLAGSDLSFAEAAPDSDFTPPLHDLLTNLNQFQRVLDDLQKRVQQNIKAVEHALRNHQ